MDRMMRGLLATVLVSTMASCASGPQFSGAAAPPPGQSDAVVYRLSNLVAMGTPFEVSVDGKVVGSMSNNSYLRLHVAPGMHVLKVVPSATAKPRQIEWNAEAGKTSYFHFDYEFIPFVGPVENAKFPNAEIRVRTPEAAQEHLKDLRASQ